MRCQSETVCNLQGVKKCNADMTSFILEAGRDCVIMHNIEERMWPSSQFSNIDGFKKNMTNTKKKQKNP